MQITDKNNIEFWRWLYHGLVPSLLLQVSLLFLWILCLSHLVFGTTKPENIDNTKHTHTPAMLATRSASWPLAVLERLGLRCLLPPCAERILRMWTSVALKKATMKGCLLWGPLRPTSPATHGFTLWPAGGDREMSASMYNVKHERRCIYRTSYQKLNFFSFIQLNVKENIGIVCGNAAQSHRMKS